MRIILVAALGASLFTADGGSIRLQPDPVERGTLRLHYVQKPIGYEKYEIVRDGDVLTLTSDFDFTDRGGRVQLAATLRTKADYTPLSFKATGKSYRFVNVDSDVRIDGSDAIVKADGTESRVPLSAPFYTVDGYAPFAAQMLLLRYWKQHGQPHLIRTVPGLPVNDVIVEPRGREAIKIGSTVVRLERYAIDGVVWGREAVWLDEHGALAAAITRAGGLSFEAVREDLEPALVGFVQRATLDRLADLEGITRRTRLLKSGTYAMTGATIVDGTGAAAIPDGVVVVRDGRIA
ncbi:MAG TPA: hypothetical protein VKI43_19005, partial [Vicinamibacterales bacterium]|nr:hypothetical protein [Vicinamibacterales bacterium]